MSLKLIANTNILDKGFIGIPCIANASVGVKVQLSYLSEICQAHVFDKSRIPNVKASQSIGMNIKDFKITCQKNSFIELKIDFDKSIKSIAGLPQGLYVDSNYIKGTIQRSGQYSVNITFQDDTEYIFVLEIPNLQRIL